MGVFEMAKFLHVAMAIAWLGGGLGLLVLGLLAERARSDTDLLTVIDQAARLAPAVFVPGSVLVLMSGLAMICLGGFAWDAWLVIGLCGIAVTAGVGMGLLGPMSARISRMAAEPGRRAEAAAAGRRFLAIVRLDYLLQFAIVFAMVDKPGWSDAAVLGGMAALLVLAAALMLAGPRRAGFA